MKETLRIVLASAILIAATEVGAFDWLKGKLDNKEQPAQPSTDQFFPEAILPTKIELTGKSLTGIRVA